ncbi:MAG: transposase, partial [Clostridium sp.]
LVDYIYIIGKNNFPNRIPFNSKTTVEWVLPPEVIIINRTDLLKYILTCNPKTKRDATIEKYIDQIKENYPAIEKVETMFKEFHALLMGGDENKLDGYLGKYSESKIQSFCNGIKKDIISVKNAISLSVSSGFVEGNNNKFKVLKRIVYGRSGLVNLEKKCKLAFLSKQQDFALSTLL